MLLPESRHVSWDLSCSLPSFPLSTTPITHSTLYPTRTSDLTSVLGSWKGPHAPGRVCEDDEKKQEALNRCHLFLKCEQRRCCAQARETSSWGKRSLASSELGSPEKTDASVISLVTVCCWKRTLYLFPLYSVEEVDNEVRSRE